MFEKRRSVISVILIIMIILLSTLLILKYIVPYVLDNVNDNKEHLYFITKSENNLYGVVNDKGKVILNNYYSKIARNQDTVYLKSNNSSYLYFIKENMNIKLNGKETDVKFACDDNDNLLPYFIMQYGNNEEEYIYRIYDLKGERYLKKDFGSLKEANKSINAKDIYPLEANIDKIKDKYENLNRIYSLSNEGEIQFIATKKGDSEKKYGIISESGKVIFDFKMKKIENIKNSFSSLYMEDDDSAYIYNNEKLIKIDKNFEYIVDEHYIIQKKGNNITKIINSEGKVIIEDILSLDEDVKLISNINNKTYLIINLGRNKYEIYDVENNKKINKNFYNIKFSDLSGKKSCLKNDSFIYMKNDTRYAVNLKDFSEYRLNSKVPSVDSFNYGILYQ